MLAGYADSHDGWWLLASDGYSHGSDGCWPAMETAMVVGGCWLVMQTTMMVGGCWPAMDTLIEVLGVD